MKSVILLIALLSFLAAVSGELVRYHGHQVLRVYPATKDQVTKLEKLQDRYDFWTEPSLRGPTDVRVTDAETKAFRNFLSQNKFKFDVMIEDVEQIVELQRGPPTARPKPNSNFDLENYHNTAEIHQFLEDIASEYPELAEVIEIGTTHLGNPLKLIRIGAKGGTRKKAYWIDAAIHAREWISAAVATYVINELLTNNQSYKNILDEVDFYIIPVLNIDGYEFTKSKDRLWRKTRQNHGSLWGCIGADPNRNYDVHFGGPGTSADKCSDIYKGPQAFSEPATAAMRDFITARNSTTAEWKIYNALHSYSQMILTPWGWTNDLPEHYPQMRALGDRAAAALTAVHGTKYQVGSVTELLTPGAGGSDDWAYGSGFFGYSYTLELRDTGAYGFLLPAKQILPTAEETWAAIKVMAESLVSN